MEKQHPGGFVLNFLVSFSGNYHLNFALLCQENKELQYMLPLGPYRIKYYILTFLLTRSVNLFLCIFVLDRLAYINLTCIIDMILFHSNISSFSLHGHILNLLGYWFFFFCIPWSCCITQLQPVLPCVISTMVSPPFSFVALDAGLPWSDAVHP